MRWRGSVEAARHSLSRAKRGIMGHTAPSCTHDAALPVAPLTPRCARGKVGETSFLEQRVEGLPCVVRRLRLPCLVRGKVLHHLRLEELALVAAVLVRHAHRDVLATLPQRGRVEGAAVAAAVDVGAALDACLLERRTIETDALLAAAVALEHLGAESPRRPAARRALETLRARVRTRTLGATVAAAAGGVAVTSAMLIARVLGFAIIDHRNAH